MTKDFLKAFGLTIRDQIIMKNSVDIKGLGRFKAEHTSQQQARNASGKLVMQPPKDSIKFKADLED